MLIDPLSEMPFPSRKPKATSLLEGENGEPLTGSADRRKSDNAAAETINLLAVIFPDYNPTERYLVKEIQALGE